MKAILRWLSHQLKQLVTILPTEQELRATFPHQPDCTCDHHFDHPRLEDVGVHLFDVRFEMVSNLESLTVTDYTSLQGTWMSLTVPIQRYILRCYHCGVRAEYRLSGTSSD